MKDDLIEIECIICKNKFKLKYSTYKARIWHKTLMRCKACIDKANSERGKLQYESLTKEEKEAHAQRTRDQLAKRTSEEWIEINKKRLQTVSNFSDEKKKQIAQKLRNYWHNLPESEKIKRGSRLAQAGRDYMKSLSEKEMQQKLQKLFEGRDKFYANMSEQERAKLRERLIKVNKDFWNNINQSDYNRYQKNRIKGLMKFYIESYGKQTKTELLFADILKRNNIKFITQWYNEKKHPQFDEIFKSNPVTGAKFVDYRHSWDFKISTLQKDILVDIDGSCHKDNMMNYCLSWNTYTEHDKIQFNDSKRPYQTDGLEAYAVLAYDDKIDDNIDVLDILSNKRMKFYQFMALINLYNLNHKKINITI